MQVAREVKEELNALSKEVFGSTSCWQKLISNGHSELITEEVTEFVPGPTDDDPGSERKVNVPVKTPRGTYRSTIKRYTVESVCEYMLERKKQLDEIKARIKQHQEEQRAKQEHEKQKQLLHEELAGSAKV